MKAKQLIGKFALWATVSCALAGVSSCLYDDTTLLNWLDNHDRRIASLEQACARINTNITSLQTILQALMDNDYVTSVTPVMQGGETIGYTLAFEESGTVTIYHGSNGANGRNGADGNDGRDGKDGSVPVIGVAQGEDGCWYWTLDGVWMLDASGSRVKAAGRDGKNGRDGADGTDGKNGADGKDGHDGKDGTDGKDGNNGNDGRDGTDGKDGKDGTDGKDGADGTDGITPLLKIENGYWLLSLDDGETWTEVGKADGTDGADGKDGKDGTDGKNGTDGKDGTDGTDGDSMFKSITQDSDNVYITLSDDTVITLPKVFPLDISFSADKGFDNDTLVLPKMYDYLDVAYVVSSPTDDVAVSVVTSADMDAYVIPDAEKPLEGVIRLRTRDKINVDADTGQLLTKVLVIVANKSCAIMRTLAVQEAKLVRIDSNHIYIIPQGGNLDFHYQTNTPVTISIPDSASTWCWQVNTKAAMADSVVTVHLEPNLGAKLRRTSVTVSNYFGVGTPASIAFIIDQDADVEPIVFADSGLKQYLLDNPKVNLNHDNEISKAEAVAVKTLYTLFGTGLTEGRSYKRFNEFQYFTGITEIPDGGFNNWSYLDSIKIPESILKIGGGRNGDKGIFQNCPKLKGITGKFTHDNTIVYDKQLLRVAPAVVYDGQFIPDGVEIIGNKAVTGSSTSDLFIPSSVKKIRDNAFGFSSIEKVRFAMTTDDPGTGKAYVDSLAENAFNHCFKLEQFIGPTNYGSLLVTPDKLGLIRDTTYYAYALGSTGKKIVIPEDMGIKRLADCVFEMVDRNGDPLPADRSKLEVIALPVGINHIGTHTFYNQAKLQKLYFHGSTPPVFFGPQALDNAPGDMWVLIPSGASIDDFAKKLNYNQIASWETWNP